MQRRYNIIHECVQTNPIIMQRKRGSVGGGEEERDKRWTDGQRQMERDIQTNKEMTKSGDLEGDVTTIINKLNSGKMFI